MRVRVLKYPMLALAGLLVACGAAVPTAPADIEPIAVDEVSPDAPVDVDVVPQAPAVEREGPTGPGPDQVPADPSSVDDPVDLDVEYVDGVMAELLAVSNAVLEDVLTSDLSEGLTEHDSARIRAVHSGPRLIHVANRFQARATDETARAPFLDADQRTGTRFETVRVLASDGACIVAIGQYDVTGTAKVPYPDDERVVIVLAAMDAQQQAELASYNPTGWRMHELESLTVGDPRVPVPEEEWPSLDYAGVLDLPCVEAVL